MSDLISRSEFLEEIEKYKFGAISNDAEREYVKDTILNFIICQPATYDVDRVVKELETDSSVKLYGSRNSDNYLIPVNRAIEIVKQGGVSDDVCEWKIVDRPHNLPIYNTSCGKIRLQYATGIDIYCNGCGKKIKVVE